MGYAPRQRAKDSPNSPIQRHIRFQWIDQREEEEAEEEAQERRHNNSNATTMPQWGKVALLKLISAINWTTQMTICKNNNSNNNNWQKLCSSPALSLSPTPSLCLSLSQHKHAWNSLCPAHASSSLQSRKRDARCSVFAPIAVRFFLSLSLFAVCLFLLSLPAHPASFCASKLSRSGPQAVDCRLLWYATVIRGLLIMWSLWT